MNEWIGVMASVSFIGRRRRRHVTSPINTPPNAGLRPFSLDSLFFLFLLVEESDIYLNQWATGRESKIHQFEIELVIGMNRSSGLDFSCWCSDVIILPCFVPEFIRRWCRGHVLSVSLILPSFVFLLLILVLATPTCSAQAFPPPLHSVACSHFYDPKASQSIPKHPQASLIDSLGSSCGKLQYGLHDYCQPMHENMQMRSCYFIPLLIVFIWIKAEELLSLGATPF